MFSLFRHPKPVGDGKAIATQVMNQAGGPVFDATTLIVATRPPAPPTVLQAVASAGGAPKAAGDAPTGGNDPA